MCNFLNQSLIFQRFYINWMSAGDMILGLTEESGPKFQIVPVRRIKQISFVRMMKIHCQSK